MSFKAGFAGAGGKQVSLRLMDGNTVTGELVDSNGVGLTVRTGDGDSNFYYWYEVEGRE